MRLLLGKGVAVHVQGLGVMAKGAGELILAVLAQVPAVALDADKGLWRTLRKTAKGAGKGGDGGGGSGYLFNHKALAKVFRAKLLSALVAEGLTLPADFPQKWVVDCKCVGNASVASAEACRQGRATRMCRSGR